MGSASQAAGSGIGVIGGLFGLDRAETARWAACFVVVAGFHAMAALSFVRSRQSSDFEAGAPVVMLELPEAPAAATAPPSDLAPGPPEMETEATPPPKEETKPPEEEAEVALPDSRAAQAAAAGRATRGDCDAIRRAAAIHLGAPHAGRRGSNACRNDPLAERARRPS